MQITVMTVPDPGDPAGFDNLLNPWMPRRAGFGRFWLPSCRRSRTGGLGRALTALAVAGARTRTSNWPPGWWWPNPTPLRPRPPGADHRGSHRRAACPRHRRVSHQWVISDIFGYDSSAPAAYLREYLQVLIPALAGEAVDHHASGSPRSGSYACQDRRSPVIAAALDPRDAALGRRTHRRHGDHLDRPPKALPNTSFPPSPGQPRRPGTLLR